jgi:hypothetical protein
LPQRWHETYAWIAFLSLSSLTLLDPPRAETISGHHAAAGPATRRRGDQNEPGATGAGTVTQLTGVTQQAGAAPSLQDPAAA